MWLIIFFSSTLKYEFYHALDTYKPILCLLTPSLKLHETGYTSLHDEVSREIKLQIRLMKTLNIFEFRSDYMYKHDWDVISKKLELIKL